MKVLHVTTSMGGGGATAMLHKLTAHLHGKPDSLHEIVVLSDMVQPEVARQLAEHGVVMHRLDIKRGGVSLRAWLKLSRLIRRIQPDIIHGWMYHGNIAAALAACGAIPIVWGIRHSVTDRRREKSLTRLMIRGGTWLQHRTSCIVYCSRNSARQHEALGYDAQKTVVIPNGFDLERFRPDKTKGATWRRENGIPEDSLLIGHAARWHPMKGHSVLVNAIAQAMRQQPGVFLVMAGHGVDPANHELTALIRTLDIETGVRLLGERHDMPDFMAALDVYVSSSLWGEAYPNVLGEAMACGIPCIATDVGDSAEIVGPAGQIVPANDTAALNAAILRMLAMDTAARERMGLTARERITQYDIGKVAEQYRQLYQTRMESPPVKNRGTPPDTEQQS